MINNYIIIEDSIGKGAVLSLSLVIPNCERTVCFSFSGLLLRIRTNRVRHVASPSVTEHLTVLQMVP